MKKILLLFIAFTICLNLVLVGCSTEKENQQVISESEAKTETENIAVDKNLLTVDVTLPEGLVGDLSDFNEDDYLSENEGIKGAKINDDGSITITMTKSKHKELMAEMKINLESTLSDLIEAEDTPYIKKIEYTKNFEEVRVYVDKESYENAFDLTPFLVGISVGMYQIYSGVDFYTTVIIQDVNTGENINSVTYPDALNN